MCRVCASKLVTYSEHQSNPAPTSRFDLHVQPAVDISVPFSSLAPDAGMDAAMSPGGPLVMRLGGPFTNALVGDGAGAPAPAVAPVILIPDTVPDSITGTNPVVTVGGPHIIGTLNTVGDQDFYKVELQGGVKYNIGLYAAAAGPSGIPLFDAFIELYDSAGNLVGFEDGKGRTPSGEAYGLDAMLTITVPTTGTYYINARAFEQNANDGSTTGDLIGDYDLFAEVNTDPPEPADNAYYPQTHPLRSIDWGTQVDGTVRNPDGNEGTRNTGNAQGTPDGKGATVGYWGQSTEGKNVIKIYFAKAGDVYTPSDPTAPGLPPAIVAVGAKDYEITAIWIALREFEKVADVVYVETQVRSEANFHYVTYSGTPGTGGTPSLLGSMNPPQEADEGLAQFNSGDYRWNSTNLQQGGFSFVTLIHEFGHGHGLAHAHDTGGNSDRMRGVKAVINTPAGPVEEPTGNYPNQTRGDFDLNQGVFTMMSYQDGWETSPYGNAATDVGYGYLGGLMAFDIAAIQDKYGVNEDWATGNDVYQLKDVNAAGTFYTSIWDAGGTDEIRYDGARNANIDLRQATLKYETGGGGFVSYAHGIYGGFTVANGATIENATSGSGNDVLRGNSVANRLQGNGGNDSIFLEAGGDDLAYGGEGDDGFYFGAAFTAADLADGGLGNDQLALQGAYNLALGTGTMTGVETLVLLSGSDNRFGDTADNRYDYALTMNDGNVGAVGLLTVNANALLAGEDLIFNGSGELDGSFAIFGGAGKETLTGGSQSDGFFFGEGRFNAGDSVNGSGGADDQLALRGDYSIDFTNVAHAGAVSGVESIVLISANDPGYHSPAGDGEFDYTLTLSDAMAGPGGLTVTGTGLGAAENMLVDGSSEASATLRLYGGAAADLMTGGGGNDILFGGLGADQMAGNGGADRFVYTDTAQSSGPGIDQILGFAAGSDKIDLGAIDANVNADGNQAFTWSGDGSFNGRAGELRSTWDAANNRWIVEGDTDGNGSADFTIYVSTMGNTPLGEGDFLL